MSSPDETPPAAEVGSLIRRSGRSSLGRWLKPTVTIALYVLVFYWIDAREISSTLKTAQFGIAGACVLLYMAGQAISTLKWRILLGPVGPVDAIPAPARLLFHRHVLQPVPPDHHRRRCGEGTAARSRNRRAGARDDVGVHGAEYRSLCAVADRARRRLSRAARASLRRLAGGADLAARRRLRGGKHRALLAAGVPDRRSIDRAVAAEADARACGVAVRGGHAVHARDRAC